MKKSMSVWDILAWIVLFSILLWVILKMLEVINTPILLEYYPIFGAIYLAGWQMHKLESVANDVKNLKKFRRETINQVNDIKLNCARNHL
ncbi:hypothetical protein CMI37_17120 [Candidatus Pacearchaeota archaeon]|nr:hypothetical protein [Candidatus Pacearchaeota archaeon]|tara:strand:- start:548 stop:817 length:270 start_codon:yes stop_codon:yes gene_type:complete